MIRSTMADERRPITGDDRARLADFRVLQAEAEQVILTNPNVRRVSVELTQNGNGRLGKPRIIIERE